MVSLMSWNISWIGSQCGQGSKEFQRGLMKKRDLAEKVAKKVGDIITVVVNEGKINSTPYLRARVWLDINKPLVRVVPITLKERMKYLVQYEKLPKFCFFLWMHGP